LQSKIKQKEYFQEFRTDIKDKKCSELLVLKDSLKDITEGFDAVILLPEKHYNRTELIEIIKKNATQ